MHEKSFIEWTSLNDEVIMKHIGVFIRHHRMTQNLTQDSLASAANISRSTLSLLERGETVTIATLIQVLRVLDQLGIMHVFEVNDILSPLALAKLQKTERKRASSKTGNRNKQTEETDW